MKAAQPRRVAVAVIRAFLWLIGVLTLQISLYVGTIILYGVGMFAWYGDAISRTKSLLFLAAVIAVTIVVRAVFIRICQRAAALGDGEPRLG